MRGGRLNMDKFKNGATGYGYGRPAKERERERVREMLIAEVAHRRGGGDVAVDDIVAVVDDRSDNVSPIFIRRAIRRANAIFYSSERNVMETSVKPINRGPRVRRG